MKYFLDTDILIDYLKGVKKTVDYINRILDKNNTVFFTSVIVVAELYSVHLDKNEKTLIENVFSSIEVVSVDYEVALIAGDLRARYKIGLADCLIAASAKKMRATIVTRNQKDYRVMRVKVITPF